MKLHFHSVSMPLTTAVRALGVACLAACTATASLAQSPPWTNTGLPPAQRTDLLIAAMTLDQKVQQLHGTTAATPGLPCGSTFRKDPAIPELSIPTFRITNGPVGVGAGDATRKIRPLRFPSRSDSPRASIATWPINLAI